jgi:ribonuclease E
MKDALKNDRARIQVGRISSFGLMEMSRQRLRTGVLEATTRECPHCDGTGLVRTASQRRAFGTAPDRGRSGQGQRQHGLALASTEGGESTCSTPSAAVRADLAEIETLRYGVRRRSPARRVTERRRQDARRRRGTGC